jgi:hypothetical protein
MQVALTHTIHLYRFISSAKFILRKYSLVMNTLNKSIYTLLTIDD